MPCPCLGPRDFVEVEGNILCLERIIRLVYYVLYYVLYDDASIFNHTGNIDVVKLCNYSYTVYLLHT